MSSVDLIPQVPGLVRMRPFVLLLQCGLAQSLDDLAHAVLALAVICAAIKASFDVGQRAAPAKHQHLGYVALPFDTEPEQLLEFSPLRIRVDIGIDS
jgi:hypothetical protein